MLETVLATFFLGLLGTVAALSLRQAFVRGTSKKPSFAPEKRKRARGVRNTSTGSPLTSNSKMTFGKSGTYPPPDLSDS